MSPLTWAMCLFLIIFAAGLIATAGSPRALRNLPERLSRDVGLPLEATIEPAIRRNARRRRLGSGIGILALTAVAIGLLAGPLAAVEGNGETWFVVGALLVGVTSGAAVAVVTDRVPTPPDGIRVARARSVGVGDYVPGSERIGARVIVAAAVLSTAAVAIVPTVASTPDTLPLWLAAMLGTGLSVVALIMAEVVGIRIVRRAQPAGSTNELAWDDALRAITLRDLVLAPIVAGLYGVVLALAAILSSTQLPEQLRNGLLALLVIASVLVAIAIGVVSAVRQPRRYYLRRLWPELAGSAR
jgi:hypothetical protein